MGALPSVSVTECFAANSVNVWFCRRPVQTRALPLAGIGPCLLRPAALTCSTHLQHSPAAPCLLGEICEATLLLGQMEPRGLLLCQCPPASKHAHPL